MTISICSQQADHPPVPLEVFFQLACQHNSAPILLIDASNGAILRANPAAEKLYGYCPSEFAAMNSDDLVAEPDAESRLRPEPETSPPRTAVHRMADGSLHTLEIHSSAITVADGAVLFCILHDITAQIEAGQANRHLEQAREQLEIIVDERTRQLNETMEQLRLESLERRQMESHITSIRKHLEHTERARVARDIHDGIGQSLQAVKLQLKMRQARCKEGEACDGYALNEVIREITSASTELREVVLALRPQFLEETNLDAAVRALCERTAKRTNLNVRAECHGSFRGISAPLKLSVFRICQEALTNIVKHAKSANAIIRLERETDSMRLVIRDDGVGGVSCPTVISQEGSGLTIMRERAELLNGSFTMISPPDMGTVITVEVPLS